MFRPRPSQGSPSRRLQTIHCRCWLPGSRRGTLHIVQSLPPLGRTAARGTRCRQSATSPPRPAVLPLCDCTAGTEHSLHDKLHMHKSGHPRSHPIRAEGATLQLTRSSRVHQKRLAATAHQMAVRRGSCMERQSAVHQETVEVSSIWPQIMAWQPTGKPTAAHLALESRMPW